MNKLPRLLPLLVFLVSPLWAAEDTATDAVRQADDARVAAIIAADGPKLDAILSADLHYAHSSGKVDNKASYMDSIVTGKTKIHSIDFEERNLTVVGPNAVIITGKCQIKEEANGKPNSLHLSFLDVWRLEDGTWRFLAWQSNHLTP